MENPLVSPFPNIVNLEEDDDDDHLSSFLNPISCRGSSKTNAISVDRYTNVRDLHLSVKDSLLPKSPSHPVINLDDYDDDDDNDVRVLHFKPSATPPPSSFGSRRKRKKPHSSSPSFIEIGQSSSSSKTYTPQPQEEAQPFMCEICVEPKPMNESFNIKGCTHSYCTNCMIKYIASKLQDNATSIRCLEPNCPGVLDPEYCRGILPKEVFDRWGNALCESVLLASDKFYCPFKDCSALMLHDEGGGVGKEVITQSECPNCKRMFCVECKAAWHSGMGCEEFRSLNNDERENEAIMLKELAKKKKWKRCPKCKFYVEKKAGCHAMRCRCGFFFCYKCGNPTLGHNYRICSGIARTTPMGRTPPMGGTLRPRALPMGRPPPMGGTSHPMGRTPTMGGTSCPMGRTPTMSGTSRPMGRTPTMGPSRPMGQTPTTGGTTLRSMGRTPAMVGTSRSIGRTYTTVETSCPRGRTLTKGGASYPMGWPLPMVGKSRPMGQTLTMVGTSRAMGRTTTMGGTSRPMGQKPPPMGFTPKLKGEKK